MSATGSFLTESAGPACHLMPALILKARLRSRADFSRRGSGSADRPNNASPYPGPKLLKYITWLFSLAVSLSLSLDISDRTTAIDEMAVRPKCHPARRPSDDERHSMTGDLAVEKLKAAGWTMVETSGFLSLVGPLWERVASGEHEYAILAQDNQPNRRGL